MTFRAFEDFKPGEIITYGDKLVTREEIIAFAGDYDPQPMHLDEEAGKASMLGGLAASGWHTIAMMMRLNVDHLLAQSTSWGSPGIKELRWKKPVYPGDRLHVRVHVLEARASKSRPEMGLVSFLFECVNQHGDVVMTQENAIMFGRREAGAAA